MRVKSAPAKPLLIFDADCNFCRFWIACWQQITGDLIDYLPFQNPQIAGRFPEIPRDHYEKAVQLIETDGVVYSGAEAVFRSLAHSPKWRWPRWIYERFPGVAPISNFIYGVVARHRSFFSFFTRMLWGREPGCATYVGARWLFLRLTGLVYFVAFVSLGLQIIGLVGQNGIVPADQVMAGLARGTDGFSWKRAFAEPTFCWYRSDDAFLRLQCVAGAILGLFVIVGIAQKLSLFILWALYLSLSTVCQVFLGYQWDVLLLETGLLAIVFAPSGLRPASEFASPVSKTGLWLLRWLLFRLMFASGCVKLLSGDPTWRNVTALTYHYQTQPLPTWIAWYAHHLPLWWHQKSTLIMYVIELGVPFLIFMPRRLRHLACALFLFLQVSIAVTGNYGFFNLLSVALCAVLLDDALLWQLLPLRLRPWVTRWRTQKAFQTYGRAVLPLPTGEGRPARQSLGDGGGEWEHGTPAEEGTFRALALMRSIGRILTATVTILILIVSSMLLLSMFHRGVRWPQGLISIYAHVAPFRSVNNYGLFAVMTTTRSEIIVEGSNDGQQWLAYEFKWKPGDLKHRPGFVEPHQPRLDWQMWFAALGDYQANPWFMNFCFRLLQGSPQVLRLMKNNPFPHAPPRYIRAQVYDYKFTDAATRRREGTWWRRELKGDYCPVLSLRAAPRINPGNLLRP